MFGDDSFWGLDPLQSAVSVGISNVAVLTYEDFAESVRAFPSDYEKFCQERDKKTLGLKAYDYGGCWSCKSNYHGFWKCPQIFLQSNILHSVKKSNKRDYQRRTEFQRTDEKHRPLLNLREIKDCAKQMRLDLVGEFFYQFSYEYDPGNLSIPSFF